MNCISNSAFNNTYFGKKNTPEQIDAPLNIGVVSPPNTLPNASLYNMTRDEINTLPYKKLTGGKKFDAGKLSAVLAFSSIALAAISFLPFIRKR